MAELLYRLGRFAARRAKAVIAAWLVLLALAGGAFLAFGGALATTFSIPDTPTQQVADRLTAEFPAAAGGTGTVVIGTTDGSALTPEQQQGIVAKIADLQALDGVSRVLDPFATQQQLADQSAELEAGRAELATARDQAEAGLAQLDAGQAQLDQARQQAEAAGTLEQAAPQLDAQQTEIDANRAEAEAGLAQVAAGETQLTDGQTLLDLAREIRMVSADGSTALVTVVFENSMLEVDQPIKDSVVATFADEVPGTEANFSAEIASAAPSVFGVSEIVGLVVAAIVLVVMLGTLVGAGLPLLTALIGVGVGALMSLSLSGAIEMASVTPVLGLMLGLAVGIDYCLFIVNRHRHQLRRGYDVDESIGLANGTSGNAVVFAGATVLVALLALNVTGIPFLGLMGSVGALCIAVAVAVAITFTPAMLSLIGMRILSKKERAALAAAAPAGGVPAVEATGPVTPMKTGRAVLQVVVSVGALAIIAIPAFDLRVNLPDGASESHDSTQYQAYSAVSEKFGEGQNGTLLVIADLPEPASEEALPGLQAGIGQDIMDVGGIVAVAPAAVSTDGSVLAFQVIPTGGPTSESTADLVHVLRDLQPLDGTVTLSIAGSASANLDVSEKLSDALPIYLAVVVLLSLIILVLVFRSIFVPVIATLGFILSFFAALGGVVAVYQWGWLGGLFGVETPGPVLNFLPTLLVGILFGLAMDYMLFLGSGMREAYVHGAPARLAVVQGFRAGRSVVTAAAIIMIAVFGGFIFSHSTMIRPIGFALAFGVLVDAFVVRMVLIPALMHLAGDKAWWMPKWLDRILPDVDVEGAKLERVHPHIDHDAAALSESAAGSEEISSRP